MRNTHNWKKNVQSEIKYRKKMHYCYPFIFFFFFYIDFSISMLASIIRRWEKRCEDVFSPSASDLPLGLCLFTYYSYALSGSVIWIGALSWLCIYLKQQKKVCYKEDVWEDETISEGESDWLESCCCSCLTRAAVCCCCCVCCMPWRGNYKVGTHMIRQLSVKAPGTALNSDFL